MKVQVNSLHTKCLRDIEVPDLWHIANNQPSDKPEYRDAILETWHLAHALLKKLREVAKAEEARNAHEAVVQEARRYSRAYPYPHTRD